MKKFLSVFMLLALCILLVACRGNNGGNSDNGDIGSASHTSQFPNGFFPEPANGLKEVVRYEYGDEGFYVIKEYYDKNDNRLEEHYYTIDTELMVLDCKIVAYNTVNGNGDLVRSEGHYISNPYHAVRETVLLLEAIEHESFDYRVLDEDGNVTLYVRETKNAKGDVTLEEYFTKGGRFIRSEEIDYRSDGTIRAYRGRNARNDLTYETECNAKGDFVSCTLYDEAGRIVTRIYADYHANGVIRILEVTPILKNGSAGDTLATKFDEEGNILNHGSLKYGYIDGKLISITSGGDTYSFNAGGFLTSYRGRADGQIGTDISITYTYDGRGRLILCETKNNKNAAKETVSYTYLDDGSVIVRHTNVYGIINNIIYTDTKGRIIRNEIHNNSERTSYQTFEYDAYGNVVKLCEYNKEKLKTETFYEYNEHGDLVKTETVSHYSSGSATSYTVYEYFENGYPKSYEKYGSYGLDDKRVYEADGGYTHTDCLNGTPTNEYTYDKYGNEIRRVYFGATYAEICEYEYYFDGSEKKYMVYYDDKLQHGYEYDENGVVLKYHKRDENGVIVTTVYTYGTDQPIREDIYKDGVYAGHTELTYFTVNTHIVKTRAEYDENGEKVYYIEYADYLAPTKEEFYENGSLTSYVYQTYVDFGGSLKTDVKEELKNGKVTKVDYDYDGQGKIKSAKIYENGEMVSTSAYTYYPNSITPKTITTHDANGNLLEMRTNDTNGNLNEMLRYAYHANGALKMTEVWHRPFGSEILSKRTEYLENGSILLEEEYNFNGQIFKKLSYVYLQNGKLDYIVTEENGTVSYTYYRYGEDGTLLKTETVSGGSVT